MTSETQIFPRPASEAEEGRWVARLTHKADGRRTSYTIIGRPFDSREEAELAAWCWWSTGYGRRFVIAVHIRRAELGRPVVEEDWLPVPPGQKDACYLLGLARPRTEKPGTLRLIPVPEAAALSWAAEDSGGP